MPKPRTKRQAIREERKRKRREKSSAKHGTDHDNEMGVGEGEGEEEGVEMGMEMEIEEDGGNATKRQRLNRDAGDNEDIPPFAAGSEQFQPAALPPPEREFFGMLSEQEQEYFRSVDELLDVDDFPSQEERQLYLAGVFAEAQGKELKLACSQSSSRLMERLILMSNTRQKKQLFEQFATHFLNLIQHRFASHCCETLFLQSAPVVTRELGGERDDMPASEDDPDQRTLPYMEELFLLTLDELEGHLNYLLTDKFASHTLRVLLIILSGRPLEQSQTKSLIHSKKKEKISAPWSFGATLESNTQLRAVPNSFNLAAKKIIADSVSSMSVTELRVLATHPTGNPALQLFLELDISLNDKSGDEQGDMSLLWRLLPGAPASLGDPATPASDFVNSMLYDPIGSRLLETLITHCPGKLFKALYRNIFASRIHSLLRNDIASYPAIRVLNRLSKEDLSVAVHNSLPEFSKLVGLSRFNVIKTLFERCHIRQATSEIQALTRALVEACGPDATSLVSKLCLPLSSGGEDGKQHEPLTKNRTALVSHGAHLTTALLAIPGPPAKAIQTSLSALSEEQILQLAISSGPTSHVLVDALATPSQSKIFHKALVGVLRPHVMELAKSEHGNKVLSSIIAIPSKGDGISVPFHTKELIISQLAEHEQELRDSFEGRRVWRSWKGDLWRTRRTDWIAWAKEVDPIPEQVGSKRPSKPQGSKYSDVNSIKVGVRKGI
ncbi:pumilio-family RNA binding repeat domain-containing protein [Biscogniauxia sp. FL1348]|nr:pumilio-family RNA binding repeat domain-containing protein [Biscogniauxia sp. FL1348]